MYLRSVLDLLSKVLKILKIKIQVTNKKWLVDVFLKIRKIINKGYHCNKKIIVIKMLLYVTKYITILLVYALFISFMIEV